MAEQASVGRADGDPFVDLSKPFLAQPKWRVALRRLWPLLRWLIGLGGALLVLWVLSSHTDELTGMGSVFDRLGWPWLIPAVAVEGVSYVSLAAVQRRMLLAGGVDAPISMLSVLTLASQAIVNSLPGGVVVGTVYGFRWFRRLGASESLAAWSLIATMVVGVVSLALVATAGLALAAGEGASLDLVPVTIGVLAITIALGALFLSRRPQQSLASWLVRVSHRLSGRRIRSSETKVARFFAQMAAFRLSGRDATFTLGWAVSSWVLDCACFALCFPAIGAGVPWKGLLLSYGAGQLAANLPITPGGLGVVEGSLTIALVAFGGNRVSTVEAVLIYRLISFWAEIVVGWAGAGWLALRWRWGWFARFKQAPWSPEPLMARPMAVPSERESQ